MSGNNADEKQAKAVSDILNAKSLYEVLGLSSPQQQNADFDTARLRKAYLTASVRVHPDKNPHPQATQAFQRVAEAWQTLGDDQKRAAYDAELRSFSGNDRRSGAADQSRDTHFAHDFDRTFNSSRMPSFQEALFAFAAATSMFSAASGGAGNASRASAASDFMETIFWAQQLAQNRQQESSAASMDGDSKSRSGGDNNSNSNNNGFFSTANKGMALGSGLRAVASAQRSLGFRKSALATEQAATTVQMAALGAAVAKAAQENPAVQRTLERGSNVVKDNPKLEKKLRAGLRMAASAFVQQQQQQQESKSNQR